MVDKEISANATMTGLVMELLSNDNIVLKITRDFSRSSRCAGVRYLIVIVFNDARNCI
ncbi:conserved hypothetical protein [Ricinus communis]|uniref:Uncharacterized protein n=1 Tax=Ricinus communis TaxID=3988 RepID=B9RM75_RICCO|nr:conserved hypothetical protein [Ricinus communis]